MGHNLKNAGIIRAGFEYQDLVAIETLLDYYRHPDRYLWVQVESTDPSFKAVDDVVACRADGKFEVTQVKFAADPENPETLLDWKWLLDHKPKGRSLIRHWADSIVPHIRANSLAAARLKTDRKPDSIFARCLDGTRVVYRRLPKEVRNVVVKQLGSAANAKLFFDNFDFLHSQPYIDDLDQQLFDSISTDTDQAGWAHFQKQVRLWSITKGLPKPDGRITHLHLRTAFSVESAKPIAQGFKVPADYQVPDQEFADRFRDRVLNNDGITVLWAPPGRGKSTFLSKFKAEIDPDKAVCIRHHYFLSLEDRSEARFFVAAISRSFEAQLEELIPDQQFQRKSLGDMVSAAAKLIEAQGKRFVVIIDGLDHVWREGQSREDTEQLFNALIPVLPGMHLVVGTQKIAEQHLPAKLLRVAPTNTWSELPLMNRAAVRGWVKDKRRAGRLNVSLWHNQSEGRALNSIADAFYKISAGLPLHLIYSFEAVARDGEEVTPERIEALPACPSGDIRDYYSMFLLRLSERGKVILHILAGLDFAPPRVAIKACLGNDDASIIGLSEIDHLLDYRELDVRPFHGSLFAYLHDRAEHLTTFLDNSLQTLEWLQKDAPNYWRQTWLWITEAKRGHADNLIAGPTRAWAINYIASGYPIHDLITVFDHAERAALDRFDLASLARLRLVKIRALNGPELQTEDFPRLWGTTAALSADSYVPAILRADLERLPARLLPALVRMTPRGQRAAVAERSIEELNGRITRSRSATDGAGADRQQELAEAIVGVVGAGGGRDVRRVIAFVKRAGSPDPLLTVYAQNARLMGDYGSVFAAASTMSGRDFDREVFASLCLEGLAPSSRPTLKAKRHPAVRCLAIVKGDIVKGSSEGRDLSSLFSAVEGPETRYQTDIRRIVYTTFFSALAAGLAGKKVESWARIPTISQGSWLAGAVRSLENLACYVATEWRTKTRWPHLDEIFAEFDAKPDFSIGYDAHSRFIAVRLALIDAAFDLALIGRALDASYAIGADAIKGARASPFWLDELWLSELAKRRVVIHDDGGIDTFLSNYAGEIEAKVSEFNERTMAWTDIALVGLDHERHEIALKAANNAIDCMIGYGWRKDAFAEDVLSALDMLIEVGDDEAKATLLDLGSAYHALTNFTDGDGTNHIRESYYARLAKHFPQHLPSLFEALIDDEDWRYVEDLYNDIPELISTATPTEAALLSTYIMPAEHGTLAISSPGAQVLSDLERKVGRNRRYPRDRDRRGSSPTSDQGASPENPPRIEDYPPGRMRELMAERGRLHIYDNKGSLIREWLDYWEGERRGAAALEDLRSILSETNLRLDIEGGLDHAAELAARLYGRSAAFDWLVRAHIVRYGWQTYWTSSKEAKERLSIVARDYKPRWKEFVLETIKPAIDLPDSRNGIVVPLTRLIYFLIAVGELDIAKAHADVMVSAFRAEISQQPLGTSPWL